jgi:hypothetical protein
LRFSRLKGIALEKEENSQQGCAGRPGNAHSLAPYKGPSFAPINIVRATSWARAAKAKSAPEQTILAFVV